MNVGLDQKSIVKKVYTKEDEERILDLIKAFNIGGRGGAMDIVDCAFREYDRFREKIKEANENA